VLKLINPRGRVVEIDEREVDIKKLYAQGFAPAPAGVEVGKQYNPVFDRGEKGAKEQRDMAIDTRTTIVSRANGDVLGVKWL
jgi:hypothetical protein